MQEKRESAIEFIKQSEGLKLKAYKDSNEYFVIGYGTKSYQGEVIITEKKAHERFIAHLQYVWKYVPDDLSVGQYVAYSSLIYNLGFYGAKKTLIDGKVDCNRILLYDKVNGKSHKGIKNRRKREYDLCVK